MKKIHLICNAHLDPVWIWEFGDGMSEAISTFRVAADFCEEYSGFVFNHNEALLYKWVEEYEPELFRRIQKLVEDGKWHIMGGWYLQPDCNMPSGESFVRQIMLGRKYFLEKFGVKPTTAINFDPFGHTRGLVQILAKSGYDSYLYTRPREAGGLLLPGDDFKWLGYDGSYVKAHRSFEGYQTFCAGCAASKLEKWIKENGDQETGLVLWGIGNHGGGPSRQDLKDIEAVAGRTKSHRIIHSTPEAYFEEIDAGKLPVFDKGLNLWAPGCYTSQIRIKQKHRRLENELYMVEKMASHASMHGLMEYPSEEFKQALGDLALAQFHDILPGSSIQPVEEWALQLMDHGLEILSRIRLKAFYKLASGQSRPKDGEIPILIYNPHPYSVKGIFECETSPSEARRDGTFYKVSVTWDGKAVPYQIEKELGNVCVDWRKRVVIEAELQPCQMNRFDCKFEVVPERDIIKSDADSDVFVFRNERLETVINRKTGLMDKYCVDGFDYVRENTFLPLVIMDDEDPWGSHAKEFRQVAGHFIPASEEECAKLSGVRKDTLEPVRIIEDGAVRTVVEAMLSWQSSYLCIRYMIPKNGTEVGVQVIVYWNEKSRMLKLSIPTAFKQSSYMGQVAFGVDELYSNGTECVAQKWTGVFSSEASKALTCINDGTYGSDFNEGEMRISLLRSPGYSVLQSPANTTLPQDRFSPRIDQGERNFKFWLNAGEYQQRLGNAGREAQWHNEEPFALSLFPSGSGDKLPPAVVTNSGEVELTALKRSEDGKGYIFRFFNPVDAEVSIDLSLEAAGIRQTICFSRYEIKTLKLIDGLSELKEVGLIEE